MSYTKRRGRPTRVESAMHSLRFSARVAIRLGTITHANLCNVSSKDMQNNSLVLVNDMRVRPRRVAYSATSAR